MRLPFIPCAVQHCDAADSDFADVRREGGPGADGAEEGIPAVSDGRGMEEGAIEGDEASGATTGEDILDDGGFSGGGGGRVFGGVGEAHLGSGGWDDGVRRKGVKVKPEWNGRVVRDYDVALI